MMKGDNCCMCGANHIEAIMDRPTEFIVYCKDIQQIGRANMQIGFCWECFNKMKTNIENARITDLQVKLGGNN